MKRKEFNIQAIKEYGAYYPGVFIIKIAKVLREEQYYDDFDNEDWQNFVHEYTHFLQDISTAHGYLYYQFKAKLLKIAVYYIKNNGYKLPFITDFSFIIANPDTINRIYNSFVFYSNYNYNC